MNFDFTFQIQLFLTSLSLGLQNLPVYQLFYSAQYKFYRNQKIYSTVLQSHWFIQKTDLLQYIPNFYQKWIVYFRVKGMKTNNIRDTIESRCAINETNCKFFIFIEILNSYFSFFWFMTPRTNMFFCQSRYP